MRTDLQPPVHARSTLPITGIDTHAHIFCRDLPMQSGRRYTPGYDVKAHDFFRQWGGSDISHGVLVQPSFLGTDNSFMCEALQGCSSQLRGIAVVEPDVDESTLDALAAAGVVGIRLNLIGLPLPDFSGGHWPSLLPRIAARRWQVEIHRRAEDIPAIVHPLVKAGVRVVVDHFGRPDEALGLKDPALSKLFALAASGLVWVKLSAEYRNKSTESDARVMGGLFLEHFGPERLLWGSDWPHTQFEEHTCFARQRALLDQWIPQAETRRIILTDTPAELFMFNLPSKS